MSVVEGMEYVARRREAREIWVDDVLRHREILRQEEPAQVAPMTDRPRKPAMYDAKQVLPPGVVSRACAPAEAGSLVTNARRVVVEQEMSRRAASRVVMHSAERARGGSPTTRPLGTRAINRAVAASSHKLDELAQRIEMLAQSTSETRGAIERLERRRNDAAEFS